MTGLADGAIVCIISKPVLLSVFHSAPEKMSSKDGILTIIVSSEELTAAKLVFVCCLPRGHRTAP